MTFSIDGKPIETLRGWARFYREAAEYRFPSDPHAEFFPRDMEAGANEIERLRVELSKIKELLFPPDEVRGDRSMVDNSVDENLDAVIIDLESRIDTSCAGCLKTLRWIRDKLIVTRSILEI